MIRKNLVLILLFFLNFILIPDSFALTGRQSIDQHDFKTDTGKLPVSGSIKQSDVVLEKAIDPEKYILGPGDVIAVNIWSAVEKQFTLVVSPEGILSIPTVGDIVVNGLVLSQAKNIITDNIKKVYKNDKVSVFLKDLRLFKIPVTGIIFAPGVYEASVADRASDIIAKAGGLIREEDLVKIKNPGIEKGKDYPAKEPLSSFRNIRLFHKNGDPSKVDLMMLSRQSNNEKNPFVSEGDVIYVPPLSEEIGTIEIYGAVQIPDKYEFSEGDDIRTIIDICSGFSEDANFDEVFISRCIENSREYQSLIVNLAGSSDDWNFELKADDRIFVRSIPEYHLRHKVTIEGEVMFPGVYSIVEKKTKLKEIIERAGGITKEANLEDAEIVRQAVEEATDPEFERLKLIPVADMTDMEYEYFKTKQREKAQVVVDFKALLIENSENQNIYLRDKDEITIPIQAKTVRVSGEVLNPGLITWQPGKNYLYYIERAGNYSFNARKSKARIIRASTGKWMKPDKDIIINFGDTIFIPEKQEVDYWTLYKDILLVLTQMATVIVLVTTVSR